jgi:hypothetical protein
MTHPAASRWRGGRGAGGSRSCVRTAHTWRLLSTIRGTAGGLFHRWGLGKQCLGTARRGTQLLAQPHAGGVGVCALRAALLCWLRGNTRELASPDELSLALAHASRAQWLRWLTLSRRPRQRRSSLPQRSSRCVRPSPSDGHSRGVEFGLKHPLFQLGKRSSRAVYWLRKTHGRMRPHAGRVVGPPLGAHSDAATAPRDRYPAWHIPPTSGRQPRCS